MRGMTILSCVGTLLIAMAGLSVSAGAAEQKAKAPPEPVPSRQLHDVFRPDPPGVLRRVFQDNPEGRDAAARLGGASDCIGDPVTPMCALDTVKACWERKNPDLCNIAQDRRYAHDRKDFRNNSSFDSGPGRVSYQIYRIDSVKRFGGAKPPLKPTQLKLVVSYEGCGTTRAADKEEEKRRCLNLGMIPIVYWLRKEGDRWLVETWIVKYADPGTWPMPNP